MVKMIFKSGYITRKGHQREGIEKKKKQGERTKEQVTKKELLILD